MVELQQHLCSELLKVLEGIVNKPQDETQQNYLKTARPMEWDKVVELYERMSACMFNH